MRLGDYDVVREIGRGGMGVVYEVRAADGRPFALKLLPTHDPETRERALREQKIAATLGEAEGFVPIVAAAELREGLALVMPLLRGGTLAQRLARGPLATDEALSLARSLARALAQAHARGIVHRDLKPANVLFGERGEPLISDLGLAKVVLDRPGGARPASLTGTGVFGGTVGYAPPEQLDDAKRATPAADVFSLGATIFESFTGSKPFGEGGLLETAARMREGRMAALHRLAPAAPRWLEPVLARALDSDPRKRFQDAAELARALDGPRSSAAPRVALSVLVVLAAAIGVAFALARGPRPPVAAPPPPPSPRLAPPPPPPRPPVAPPKSADEYLAEADAAMKAQQGDQVIAAATSALAIDPDLVPARMFLGIGNEMSGRSALARDAFTAVIERAPDFAPGWLGRARARLPLGDPKGALADSERAHQLAPTMGAPLEVHGNAALELGDLAMAREDARRLMILGPRNPLPHDLLGRAHERSGELEAARDEYTRAIELAPDYAEPRWHRARLRFKMGDRGGALEDARSAVDLDPRDMRALATRADYRLQVANDARGALADAEAVIARSPGLDLAHDVKGQALFKLHLEDGSSSAEDAIASVARAISIAPGRADYHVHRAFMLEATGNRAGARDDLDCAIELAPREGGNFLMRAALRNAEHDFAGALADASRAVELGNPLALQVRAVVRHDQGDVKGAVEDLARFLESPPPLGERNLASVRERLEAWRAELR
jgi:tetratricopeptide (TPR) repeat protein